MKPVGLNLISHKYKYVLKTFPKSGCSTLRNIFLKVHFDEFSESDKNTITSLGDHAFHDCEYEYISRHDDILNLKDYYKFSIVRNSYERVISMYFNVALDIPDFNCLDPTRSSKESYINRGPKSEETFDQFLSSFAGSVLGRSNLHRGDHYAPQFINKNFNTYLYLNELNKTLPRLYKDVIKIESSKLSLIKKLVQDKKERSKIKVYKINHKLNNYSFTKDELNLNIMKNGVPQKNLMITEENAQIIKKLYKEEIDYHGFDYKHLL